ncbi:CRISPR-associated protein Cas4 [Nitrospirillum amazonense]|uniref:CRISPR-associated exonuclease Cas4 n=1 Tax=Nitrospirillum amazonense TaxID=28077 RepID=A0A560EHD7_9PROT|nr:CRISPR-associated protein Cas4 [Nitrospirillum amazonense]TWB08793.1 CRISPR-associated protein Cas4 [Nitrospirillum amazonense]
MADDLPDRDGPPGVPPLGHRQLALPLLAPSAGVDEALVPAGMVNAWAYCPRLAYLEWVDGEWADSGDTEEGRRVHARVDAGPTALPPPDDLADDSPPFRTHAVELSSERLGLVAKLDVLEGEDGFVTPVEYKKGRRPHVDAGAHEPERVQLCAQVLVLEENGYRVRDGFLWYAGSRERVPVVFDEGLYSATICVRGWRQSG